MLWLAGCKEPISLSLRTTRNRDGYKGAALATGSVESPPTLGPGAEGMTIAHGRLLYSLLHPAFLVHASV